MSSEDDIIRQLEKNEVTVKRTDVGLEVYNAGTEELVRLSSQLERMTKLKGSFSVGEPVLQGPELRFLHHHQNLRELNVYGMPISGEHLSVLPTLPNLEELHCTPEHNVEEGLKFIGNCKALRVLGMENSQIPDDAVPALAGLEGLNDLRLSGNPISSGARVVTHMKQLRHLSLERTLVGDDDLRVIGGLTELESLFIGSPNVTDAGVEHLANCLKLTTLCVESDRVTSDGIRHLSRLPQLESLYITASRVDVRLFENLSTIRQLRRLHCRGEGISVGDREKLHELVPKCDILWWGTDDSE